MAASLTETLQTARKARRLSQLALALRMGVSQRHVSFVESGRARPSRELLLAWLQELDAPLGVRNTALLQAGFAPVYSASPLDDPALTQANRALERLLSVHEPMPALVIDAGWNLRQFNRGARWLASVLVPWAPPLEPGVAVNMLDLLAHPDGLTRPMRNLAEVGPALLAHLRDDAAAQPELAPRVEAFAALLRARLGPRSLAHASAPSAPTLTTRFATPHGELAFFSTFTTFGTPQSITLASLRVEHLFAADDATLAVLHAHVA